MQELSWITLLLKQAVQSELVPPVHLVQVEKQVLQDSVKLSAYVPSIH